MVVPTRLLAFSLFTSFAVATSLFSSKYSRDLLVHESRDVLPIGFSLVGPAASHTPLSLRIALTQSNPDAIVALGRRQRLTQHIPPTGITLLQSKTA